MTTRKPKLKCPKCGHQFDAECAAMDFAPDPDVRAVYEHHCKVMSDDPLRARDWKLRPVEKHISARLRDGYSVAQLMHASDNLSKSKWHRGENPNKRDYCSPQWLFGSPGHTDEWVNLIQRDAVDESAPRGSKLGTDAQRLLAERNRGANDGK